MTTQKVRWGILGTGRIAGIFTTGLAAAEGAELVAVGSRSQASADRFGDQFTIPHRHASYDALAADPEVDAIYVATPHPEHLAAALACIAGGKAVLCEKPLTLNAGEARQLVQAAHDADVFLMEAMWPRFRPPYVRIREIVAEGQLGEVNYVTATIGWKSGFDPEFRLYNPALGGGALLDGGVYPISFASMLLGPPDQVVGAAILGKTGVDEIATIALGHPNGSVAAVGVTIRSNPISIATIVGTDGRILVDHDFHRPVSFTLFRDGAEPERFEHIETTGNGYQYETMEVGRCLAEGLRESPVMPHAESISIMETMDTLRAQWGVKYPQEQ